MNTIPLQQRLSWQELLSNTVKRSSDLINGLGITPLATIPYMDTPRAARRHLGRLAAVSVAVVIAVPVLLWLMDTYLMPFEVMTQRIAAKIGFYI